IHPQAGNVFRPLLGIRRAALRAYLQDKRQKWREDASNRDETRTRAHIRHKLMPILEKKFQSPVVEHLCRLAELAREDNDYLEFTAGCRINVLSKENKSGISIPVRDIALGQNAKANTEEALSRPDLVALPKRMIRQLVRRVKPHAGELGSTH